MDPVVPSVAVAGNPRRPRHTMAVGLRAACIRRLRRRSIPRAWHRGASAGAARGWDSHLHTVLRPAASIHHVFPFCVTENSHHGVQGIQGGIEINLFVYIQAAAYGVHQNPCNPLFQPFAGKHPHAHDGKGRGEGIPPGHGAVGVGEKQADGCKREHERGQQPGPHAGRHAADGHFLPPFLLAGGPNPHAVHGGQQIIDIDAEVGIEPGLPVDIQRNGRHGNTCQPHPAVGLIFPIQIGNAYQCACYLCCHACSRT